MKSTWLSIRKPTITQCCHFISGFCQTVYYLLMGKWWTNLQLFPHHTVPSSYSSSNSSCLLNVAL
jgi:hypothetical protein